MSEQTLTPTAVTLTGRELLKRLADLSDLDAEVYTNFRNSDPLPVTDVSEDEDGMIVLTSS